MFFKIFCEELQTHYPLDWQFGFQVPATPVMEGIIRFHHDLFFFLVSILAFVFFILYRAISKFNNKNNPEPIVVTHAPMLEIIWTIIPAIILFIIAIPSFSLLYSMDFINVPFLTFKVIGHQWYWSYEFLNDFFFEKKSINNNINKYNVMYNHATKEINEFFNEVNTLIEKDVLNRTVSTVEYLTQEKIRDERSFFEFLEYAEERRNRIDAILNKDPEVQKMMDEHIAKYEKEFGIEGNKYDECVNCDNETRPLEHIKTVKNPKVIREADLSLTQAGSLWYLNFVNTVLPQQMENNQDNTIEGFLSLVESESIENLNNELNSLISNFDKMSKEEKETNINKFADKFFDLTGNVSENDIDNEFYKHSIKFHKEVSEILSQLTTNFAKNEQALSQVSNSYELNDETKQMSNNVRKSLYEISNYFRDYFGLLDSNHPSASVNDFLTLAAKKLEMSKADKAAYITNEFNKAKKQKQEFLSRVKKLKLNTTDPSISYDSYMVPDDSITDIRDRLLKVDNPLYLPIHQHVRLLITSSDVIHSWAVPALGIKVDACPGRLNQTTTYIYRPGIYYGQCSEICGVNHGFMPINVNAFNLLPDEYAGHVNLKAAKYIFKILLNRMYG